jgi:hypothetical protein
MAASSILMKQIINIEDDLVLTVLGQELIEQRALTSCPIKL